MEIFKTITYEHIDESDMIGEIDYVLRNTNLQFYRIETFMSPRFLKITIYELSYEEAHPQHETK